MVTLNIVNYEIPYEEWDQQDSDIDLFWMCKFFNDCKWPKENICIEYSIPDNIPFEYGEELFRYIILNMGRAPNIDAKFTISIQCLDNRIYFSNKEQFLETLLGKMHL